MLSKELTLLIRFTFIENNLANRIKDYFSVLL